MRINALLPYSIVAVLCFVSGFVSFKCLPETANKPTPETMASIVTCPGQDNYNCNLHSLDAKSENINH